MSTLERFLLATRAACLVWLWSCALGTASAQAQTVATVLQALGAAQVDDQPTQPGTGVQAMQKLSTGADGYLYLKTLDGGLLILRPNSRAVVREYHTDPAAPEQTRVRIELLHGVARSVTGAVVKQARQGFRFNTPVAAIGVRGTDFSVQTDAQITRVAVHSGGVRVSAFDAHCSPDSLGPCDTAVARDLFAGLPDAVLQATRGQAGAQLLRGAGLSPDRKAPPLESEPAAAPPGGVVGVRQEAMLFDTLAAAATSVPPAPAAPQPPSLIWGRWQTLADAPADFQLSPNRTAGYTLIAINPVYALMRRLDASAPMPPAGSTRFALQSGLAQVLSDAGGVTAAQVAGGSLRLDWAARRFDTQLSVQAAGQAIALQAQGQVFQDGTFENTATWIQPGNMRVQGAWTQQAGLGAAYLFQSRLATGALSGQSLYGRTHWAQ